MLLRLLARDLDVTRCKNEAIHADRQTVPWVMTNALVAAGDRLTLPDQTMHHFASIALLALLPFAPAYVLAQESELEEAIETIATSSDRDVVNAAVVKLRAGGLPAIRVLVQHLSDSRRTSVQLFDAGGFRKIQHG